MFKAEYLNSVYSMLHKSTSMKEGLRPRVIPEMVGKRWRVLIVSQGQGLVKKVLWHGVQHLVRQRFKF